MVAQATWLRSKYILIADDEPDRGLLAPRLGLPYEFAVAWDRARGLERATSSRVGP
ncbi:MAG: hypothetical protein ABI488_22100 [Polyangiaceae bacterium]